MSGIRDLSVKREFKLSKFLVSWEMILVYILIIINLFLMIFQPELYFIGGTIQSIIKSGMDLSAMVMGMTLVLLLGEIDISVASIMIVSAAVMGLMYQSGSGDVWAVSAGIAAGAACGAFNGVLTAKCKMPSVIVTIATALLFRGIIRIVLGENTLKVFPQWFSALAWKDAGGIIPYSLIFFVIIAVIFAALLHKTKFGREIYLIGNNDVASTYSGIRAARIKIIVFTVMGITAALSGILFAGRLGGCGSGMAEGYELKVIAIAVLGGVSTDGGKGRIYGPFIAVFIMEFLTKTLDLLGVHANIQKIIIGVILLAAVLLPKLDRKKLKTGHTAR